MCPANKNLYLETRKMKDKNENNNIQLLSAKELAGKLLLSARTVWRLRSAHKLPKPVCVGGSIRWRLSDIQRWLRLDCPDQRTFDATRGGDA